MIEPIPVWSENQEEILGKSIITTFNMTMKLTLGGSVVIFIPACKMDIGNSGWGLLLSQIRKSGWGFSTCSCSTNLSNWGIQLSDRWQFARNTQFPSRTPSLIMRVAMGACPWPNERAWKRFVIPHDSASMSSALVGSYKYVKNKSWTLLPKDLNNKYKWPTEVAIYWK